MSAGSERFFHLDGVRDAVVANLEMGNGGLEDEGAEVVNGWRGGGGGGVYGRVTRSCFSSRTSLGERGQRRVFKWRRHGRRSLGRAMWRDEHCSGSPGRHP